jgi:dienelactone hydrolase
VHSPKTIVIFISDIGGGDDKRKRTARKLNIDALSIFIPELKFIKEMKCQSLKTAAEHVEAKSSILNTISESMLLTII